jgi:hypothetical protein
MYDDQAAYCAYLLRRTVDPSRRVLIERELQDWVMLAHEHRLWNELDTRAARSAEPIAAVG